MGDCERFQSQGILFAELGTAAAPPGAQAPPIPMPVPAWQEGGGMQVAYLKQVV
jgi:hypothetical protein